MPPLRRSNTEALFVVAIVYSRVPLPLVVFKEDFFQLVVLASSFIKFREKVEQSFNGVPLRYWTCVQLNFQIS